MCLTVGDMFTFNAKPKGGSLSTDKLYEIIRVKKDNSGRVVNVFFKNDLNRGVWYKTITVLNFCKIVNRRRIKLSTQKAELIHILQTILEFDNSRAGMICTKQLIRQMLPKYKR